MKYSIVWGTHNLNAGESYLRVAIRHDGQFALHTFTARECLGMSKKSHIIEQQYWIDAEPTIYVGFDKEYLMTATELGIMSPTLHFSRVLRMDDATDMLIDILSNLNTGASIPYEVYCDLFENVRPDKWAQIQQMWKYQDNVHNNLSI